MRHSKEDKRHILLALLGRTPQVLTETLYALCVELLSIVSLKTTPTKLLKTEF